MVVHLAGMADTAIGAEKGLASAIAAVIVYDSLTTPGIGIYLDTTVQTCGRAATETCAKQLLPLIDRAVQDLQTHWADLWMNTDVRAENITRSAGPVLHRNRPGRMLRLFR